MLVWKPKGAKLRKYVMHCTAVCSTKTLYYYLSTIQTLLLAIILSKSFCINKSTGSIIVPNCAIIRGFKRPENRLEFCWTLSSLRSVLAYEILGESVVGHCLLFDPFCLKRWVFCAICLEGNRRVASVLCSAAK